ncbi:MAG TPA: BREX system ATP-binding domain-containing protein [Candidatus Limnocylindrales bacterium]|nr:BREX system ATP-binding domain-containing protein [Candidatus Limnocylindrales bacterium]
MSQTESLLSPVIVGRDDLIAVAERRLDEVRAGHGQLLLLSGEAGIGKTRLLAAIRQLATERGFRVAGSDLAPQDRDVLAASLLDLARSMRRDPAFGSMGRDLLELTEGRLSAQVARRRDMVMEIVDLLGGSTVPTALLFEDLQWADDLSLETLTDLARQTRDVPLFLVGAYRSNEALNTPSLREWRSRLVTQRIAEEVRLSRLSRDDTALMTTLILANGLPAPREVVDAVYARTDGVPLHVEELLSALGRERLVDSGAVRDAAVPETLEDATLTRIRRLSPDAQAVARAGAVLGRSFVPSVLAGIMNLPVESLDDPIQELVDHDVLDPVRDNKQYDFRHQLLRDALYRSVTASERRRYHARAAEFGAQLEGASSIHASVHFERAGMSEEAFRTALAAAKEAMAMSSHREAFELMRRAIDNEPPSLTDEERVRLYLLYSDAAGNVDANALSAELAMRARELALRIGDHLGAIEGLVNLNEVSRREGDPMARRRDLGRQLHNEIDAAPPSKEREVFRVICLRYLGLIELDAGQYAEARRLYLEAGEVSVQIHGASGRQWVESYLAQLDVIDGRVTEGLAAIRSLGEVVRGRGDEDSGVSCYRYAAIYAIRALDYRAASDAIDEGLRYAESVEQTFCGHWLQSGQAVVSWASGRWDDAFRQGGQTVSDAGWSSTRAMAHWAMGYVEACRGRRAEAEAHLLPAAEFARRAGFLDMALPAEWGLAEAALLDGDADAAATRSEDALRSAREGNEWMHVAPFAVTGVRAHIAAGRPDDAARFLEQFLRAIGPGAEVAKPAIVHATGLVRLSEGSTTAARTAFETAIELWDARGRRWEALWARLDLAGVLLRSNRYADAAGLIREVQAAATELGSEPLLARAAQLSRVAKGRGEQLERWHPLTTREFEVARKIAEGRTNAELADELGISPKTASAHVEHILAKLGVSRRAEIAAWAIGVLAGAPAAATTARVAADAGR